MGDHVLIRKNKLVTSRLVAYWFPPPIVCELGKQLIHWVIDCEIIEQWCNEADSFDGCVCRKLLFINARPRKANFTPAH